MNEDTFKPTESWAQETELSNLRAQREKDEIAIGRLERSHAWHVAEIKKLDAELEDVRQQRETLKAECAALKRRLEISHEMENNQRNEAKRRGEMLKQAYEFIC